MPGRARMAILPDGRRLHLQHGPIDIVAEAFGEAAEVSTAYRQAGTRALRRSSTIWSPSSTFCDAPLARPSQR